LVTAYFFPRPATFKVKAFFDVSTNLTTWKRYQQTYPTNGGWLVLTNPWPKADKVFFRCGFIKQ